MGLGLLRRSLDPSLVTHAWISARSGEAGAGRPCPMCGAPMRLVSVPGVPPVALDVCTVCELIWFDPAEYEVLPRQPRAAEPLLPPEAAAAPPIAEVRGGAERRRRDGQHEPPGEWWKYLAGLFGMPVEDGEETLYRPPWATWALAAVTSLLSCAAFPHLAYWVARFGLVPAQAARYAGVTFVTSFFLHAGVVHLAANMYFLMIFGDNVEEALGAAHYLLLVFLAAVTGGAVHAALDPHQRVPVIGASAGIAGVVAFYACRFPRVRLKFLWSLWLRRWFTLPAWAFFAIWIAVQAAGVVGQLRGHSSVSALGHVGGASIGVLFYLAWRFAGDDGPGLPAGGE